MAQTKREAWKLGGLFPVVIFLMTELQFSSAIPDLTLHSSEVTHLKMVKDLDLIGGSECVFL